MLASGISSPPLFHFLIQMPGVNLLGARNVVGNVAVLEAVEAFECGLIAPAC